MKADIFSMFWAGAALFSAIALVLTKDVLRNAFYLFFFLMAVAGIFASLGHSVALIAQLILYVGGIMVLVGFVLFLNGNHVEEKRPFRWTPSLFLFSAIFLLMVALPLNKFFLLFENLQEPDKRHASEALSQVGYRLASDFGAEFELLGFLLLAALTLSGLYLKEKQV